jgi:acetoin utilization deacetylase AcuC-like enzyme
VADLLSMSTPTIFHSPRTLLHHSLELIGHELIAAHECPDRIQRILKALAEHEFPVNVVDLTDDELSQIPIPSNIHSKSYIDHLKTIFDLFLKSNMVKEDGCILPECFPHQALLKTVEVTPLNDEKNPEEIITSNDATLKLELPSDPYAHLGYYSFDMSTGMSKDTFRSAMASVALALRGVATFMDEQFPGREVVFALTRPPGHHACHALAGGYCYINNVAVAAEYLLSKMKSQAPSGTRSRVVILDLDFHHGNGTQAIFYNRREPAYISIHGKGEYPYYTGGAAEYGSGGGVGYNRNFPLSARPNSTRDDYLNVLDEALNVIRGTWQPEYLLVSMGFDTFQNDILGGFELGVDDYKVIGGRIRALGLPVLVLLEGGYHDDLGELVASFLRGLTRK